MTANPLSTIPPIGPTTGVASPSVGGKFKPIDPVRLLRQYFPYLILAGIVGLIIGGSCWFVARKYNPKYGSDATLVAFAPPRDTKDVGFGRIESNQIDEIQTFIRNEIAYIRSEDLLRRAIQRPGVRSSTWFQQFNGDIREAAKALEEEHLSLTPVRESTYFRVSVNMPNVADAQDILANLLEVYLGDRKNQLSEETLSLNSVQQRELEFFETRIRDLETEIGRFIERHELATVKIEQSGAALEFEQINRAMMAMQMELDATLANAEQMIADNEADPNRPMSESEEQMLRQMPSVLQREEQIRQINENLRLNADMGLGEEHRQNQLLRKQMASVEQELETHMEQELMTLRAAQVAQAQQFAEGIRSQMAKLEEKQLEAHTKMRELTETLQQWESLQEELDVARERRTEAQLALQELRAYSQRPDATRVRTLKRASEAELVSPMWYVWIPGITMLFVGLTGGVIFLRELMDQRVKSPADVKMLPDATLLGLLPSSAEDPSNPKNVDRIVQAAPTGLMAESYRQVRTSVLSRMDRRGYKTLVMVAAQPEAGTSSGAQHLAASLAYNGRNVLIVDCNFRRPGQHDLADIRNDRGLVDVLRDQVDPADVIQKDSDLPLSVMPTGRAGEAPPELLEGPAFRSLLGRLEAEYDIVIIDAPPALLTSEAQLLAKHVDAIAVVVNAGEDKRGMVERMLGKLDGQRADVLGVVLNKVRTAAGGYFRKNYEDFYNYRKDAAAYGANGKKRSGKAAKAEAGNGSDRVTADDVAEVLMAEDDERHG